MYWFVQDQSSTGMAQTETQLEISQNQSGSMSFLFD